MCGGRGLLLGGASMRQDSFHLPSTPCEHLPDEEEEAEEAMCPEPGCDQRVAEQPPPPPPYSSWEGPGSQSHQGMQTMCPLRRKAGGFLEMRTASIR